MNIIELCKRKYLKEQFNPSLVFGVIVNPSFILRRRLYKNIKRISPHFKGGKLLDVGCGQKPYQALFEVDQYIGIELEGGTHDYEGSLADLFYSGGKLPLQGESFDWVLCSEVLEHVAEPITLLEEMNAILKKNGKILLTCPFVWDEHEVPNDFARYSSFGISEMMTKAGFEVNQVHKSSNFLAAVFQLSAIYVRQYILPKNKILKFLLTPILVTPILILGIFLDYLLPAGNSLYLNTIVVATKV